MMIRLTNLQGRNCLVNTMGIRYMNESISGATGKVATEIIYGKNHSIWVQESVDRIEFLQKEQATIPDTVPGKSRELPEEEHPFPHDERADEKEYEIWMSSNDVARHASILGRAYGRNFQEACDNWAHDMRFDGRSYHSANNVAYYWGCRLYDNEYDACVQCRQNSR